MAISAVAGKHVRELLYAAAEMLRAAPPLPEVAETPVYRAESDPREFQIERIAEGWRVHGEAIERAAEMTYWEHFQSVRRFQRILETLGIDAALRKAGIEEGDTVFIADYELEWQD
jgi:GTP-binding protein